MYKRHFPLVDNLDVYILALLTHYKSYFVPFCWAILFKNCFLTTNQNNLFSVNGIKPVVIAGPDTRGAIQNIPSSVFS